MTVFVSIVLSLPRAQPLIDEGLNQHGGARKWSVFTIHRFSISRSKYPTTISAYDEKFIFTW
jgi:hypothetical protein